MNKRAFLSFALLAVLLAVIIPIWAFSKDGSSDETASTDEESRELFVANCGSCHTLAAAGTDGVVGPNLDERLAGAVSGEPTPEAVQASRDRTLNAIVNGLGEGAMPAGILQGAQAEQVADYVARMAGQ